MVLSCFASVAPLQQEHHGGTRAGRIASPIRAPAQIIAASPDQLSAWSGTMTAIEVALAACCVVMSSRALRASNPAFAGRGRRMRGCCATTSSAAATLNSGSNLVGTCSPVSQSTIGRMAVLEKDSLGRYRFQVDEGGVTPQTTAAAGNFDISMQNGVCAPYGEPGVSYWDPAGLASDIDADTFRQYRKAELKHGRICMLGVLGLVAQHTWRFKPFFDQNTDNFQQSPSGIGAAAAGTPSAAYLGLLILIAGYIELNASDDGREPGDFGDPFRFARSYGLDFDGGDDVAQWKNFELNHGRLAMIGFLGAVMAECATGLDAVDQWRWFGPAVRRTTAIILFPQEAVGDLESFRMST